MSEVSSEEPQDYFEQGPKLLAESRSRAPSGPTLGIAHGSRISEVFLAAGLIFEEAHNGSKEKNTRNDAFP